MVEKNPKLRSALTLLHPVQCGIFKKLVLNVLLNGFIQNSTFVGLVRRIAELLARFTVASHHDDGN